MRRRAAAVGVLCLLKAIALTADPRGDGADQWRKAPPGISALKLPCGARGAQAARDGGGTAVLTITLPGLLANLMFAVAALEGLADSLQRVPHLSIDASCLLAGDAKADDLSVRRVSAFAAAFGIHLCEGAFGNASWHDSHQTVGWGRFDGGLLSRVQLMNPHGAAKSSPDLARVSATFSPRYFEHLGRDRFRQLFAFPMHVAEKARAFVDQARAEYHEKNPGHSVRLRVVGVHARRGDKNWEFHMFNEWSHGAAYIQRAIDVFGRLFGLEGHLLYVVTSDDPDWVRATMGSMPNVVISPFLTSPECKMDINCHEPLIDMAILSSCDAIVVSGSSTYSWWAGYLSSEAAVVIAPRLPVNPRGEFGPCSTQSPPINPGARPGLPAPAQRRKAHLCRSEPADVAARETCEGGGGGKAAEILCEWIPGGQRHVRCENFWSEDYYPDDWVLLDEVRVLES